MFFKIATFFTVAVFMVQPNEVMLQYSPNPVCNGLIANLITTTNITLGIAINQTALVAGQFYAQVKGFELQVQSNVNSIMAGLDAKIAAEVAKSGGIASKIYNCTKLSKPKLDAFANSTFYSLTGCATEKITQGINNVNGIFASVAAIFTILANATNRINATCPAPKSSDFFVQMNYIGCVNGAVTQITLEVASNSFTITTNGANLAILISSIPNFPTEFATCITTRTSLAVTNALPIILDIAKCTVTPTQ